VTATTCPTLPVTPRSTRRLLFVSENIGGHATLHRHLRLGLREYPDVVADFYEVPVPGLLRRVVGAQVPGLARLDLDLQMFRAQMALSYQVRRKLLSRAADVDLLHVYTHNAALLSADLLRRQPTIVTLDATTAQSGYLLPYRYPTRFTPYSVRVSQRWERRVYDAATVLVAKTEWVAASLREEYGVDPERIRIIPFGMEIPELADAAPAGLSAGLPRVTFIGNSLERKGGWRLLELYRRGLREHCELTLVTPQGVPAEAGVTVVNDIRGGMGADSRLLRLLRDTAVLAFPSQQDTFGYAAMEAQAAGVPVVAFRVTGVQEVIENEVTGLLVDPGDYDGLAVALLRLLDDEALRHRMGAAARRRALERFDRRVTTMALLTLVGEVLGTPETAAGSSP
jgi:starch synthase